MVDECGIYGSNSYDIYLPMENGQRRGVTEHLSHQSFDARFQTFDNWPPAHPIKSKDLSEAGFFYLGE